MSQPAAPEATLIIAQHGRSALTLDCIRSFQQFHGTSTRVVVVDDGSPAEHLQALADARLANVELFGRPREGLTAAWNAGSRWASSDVLVFLNNDVTTSAAWLASLIASVQQREAVIGGIELRTERAIPESILARLPTRRFAAGWCFAVRRDEFEAVGGFEPSLHLYFSDTDLQARLLARRGLGEAGIRCCGSRGLRHRGHATTSLDPHRGVHWQADRVRFLRLWQPEARPD